MKNLQAILTGDGDLVVVGAPCVVEVEVVEDRAACVVVMVGVVVVFAMFCDDVVVVVVEVVVDSLTGRLEQSVKPFLEL